MIDKPRPSVSHIVALFLALLCLFVSPPVMADDELREAEHDNLRDGVASGRIMSLSDLRRIVLARVDGDIVSARIEQENGFELYEFRVLRRDGRLVEVEVDARSGHVLEIEND